MNEPYELNDDIIELLDDDGNPVAYEHIMTLHHNENSYIVLATGDDDDESEDVVILRIDKTATGEDVYSSDIDDATLNEILKKANAMLSQD